MKFINQPTSILTHHVFRNIAGHVFTGLWRTHGIVRSCYDNDIRLGFNSFLFKHRQSNNIRRTLGNKIADHSDVVGASPVGPAPATSSFST